jgi:hypothetical protein
MRISATRGCLLAFLVSLTALAIGDARAERLVVCGWDEVFVIDANDAERAPESGEIKKLWSWRATESEGLPEGLRKKFGSTDECKPTDDGKSLLIASSGGACALVERETGKTLWYASVPNAHSIEALPGGRVVAAASTAAEGNRLILFDLAQPEKRLWEGELHSAHGVVWDEARRSLWALGFDELRRYELVDWDSSAPSLKLVQTFDLPDEGGHDLQAVPASDDLVLSTHAGVRRFDREKGEFRPVDSFAQAAHVKCVSHHPTSGRVAVVQASEEAWWSDTIRLREPEGKIVLPGEKIYKVRWLVEETADADE